jgi:hypothetical protein
MVGIIVSSDWRRLFDDATLIRLFGRLAARFVGVVEGYGSSRSEEMLAEVKRRMITPVSSPLRPETHASSHVSLPQG